jgi:hypothetical protein
VRVWKKRRREVREAEKKRVEVEVEKKKRRRSAWHLKRNRKQFPPRSALFPEAFASAR